MIALSDYEITVLLLSIKVASISSIITFFPSFIMAYLLATKNFTGKSLIDSLIHLPLVLPPVVIGFFLLIIFGKNGLVGDIFFSTFNIRISFSWIAAMIASSVMGFPLFVRSIRQSVSEIDPKIIEAAQTLGANKIKIFKNPITTPKFSFYLKSQKFLHFGIMITASHFSHEYNGFKFFKNGKKMQKNEEKKMLFEDAKKTEIYKKVMELFPNAELTNVEEAGKKEEDI